MRDRDVRIAIRDAMVNTDLFNEVSLGHLPETHGASAGLLAYAVIRPDTMVQTDAWDGGPETGGYVDSTVNITLMVREQDDQIRDEKVEQLVEATKNAIQGQCLASLTLPDLTRFVSAKWVPSRIPEQRVLLVFRYRYLFNSWNDFDESD